MSGRHRILITGGSGMLGHAVAAAAPGHVDVRAVGRAAGDLCDRRACEALFASVRPTHVIHLAARVGGVLENTRHAAEFFASNLLINTHVLEAAGAAGVVKVLAMLSSCVYPDGAILPLRPEQLHDGEPHPSNFGYAYAKRMLEVHARAMRQEHGLPVVCLIPNNLYGPHDNFDLESGHVIPAMIRKIHAAKTTGPPAVLWGDGSPLREFTYADDLARAIWWALDHYDGPPLNVGTDEELSIGAAAEAICRELECDPALLRWDPSMPSGQRRKPTDTRAFRELSGHSITPFHEGIARTVKWYVDNYPRVRGIETR